MAGSIRSLIVKIGGDTTSLEQAIGKAISRSTNLQQEIAKIGDKPIAQQAERDLARLGTTLAKITADQARLADTGNLAARGIQALGGPTRLTVDQLGVMNRTLQQSIDAYRALGQTAPAELQKVAAAVRNQQRALADQQRPGGVSGLVSGLGASLGVNTSTLGAGAIGAAFVGASRAALDYADSLTKLADKTKISIDGLQRIEAVAKPSGNTLEQVTGSVTQMQKRIAEGAPDTVQALGEIGLSIADLKNQAPDDQFFAIAKGIQSIQDPAEQTRLAMALLGKSGAEVLPTIRADIDGLKDSTVRASEESVQAWDTFGDAIERWKGNAQASFMDFTGSVLALVQSLNQLPDAMARARAAGGGPVAEPNMLANFGPNGLNVPDATLAKLTPQQIAMLARGEGVIKPNAPQLPQIGGLTQRGDQAELASTAKALEALNAGLKEQATRAAEAAAAQKKSAEALAKWRENAAEVLTTSKGYAGVLAEVDGRVVEGVRYYTSQGVALSKVAEFYGLTAGQAAAFEHQLAAEAEASKKAESEAAKLAAAHQKWLESTQAVLEATRGTTAVLDELDGTVLEGVRYYVDLGASLKDVATMYGLTTEQAAAFTAALKEQQALAASAPDLVKKGLGKPLALTPGPNPALQGLSLAGKTASYLQGSNLSGIALQAIASGGGAKGAATAVASQVGSDFTKSLAKSLAKEGASNGAKMAAGLLGPLGAFAGPAIDGVIRLIKGAPEWKKLQSDIGRDFGTKISDGLAKALEEDSKKFGRQAASLLHLDQIIGEAGGVDFFGTDLAISKTRDLFSMLQTGQLTTKQVGREFNTLFGQLLPEATTKATGLISRQFQELIAQADQFGIKSQALTEFRTQQAGGAASGLAKFLGASTGANDTAAKLSDQMAAIDSERSALMGRALSESERQRAEELDRQWDTLKKQLETAKAIKQTTAIQTGPQAQAFAAATAGTFAELMKNGVPVGEAVKQVQPAVDALNVQLAALGVGGGEAFDRLRAMVALASDEIAGPALDAVSGIGQALAGLSNTGNLTQEEFAGLASQVAATRDQLVAQGKDGDQALRLMQPTLQTIYELQSKFGYGVDDATQALLDQAKAAGIVGDAMKSPQQQQIDALNKTNDILSRIAEAMGVKLPAAAAEAATQINDKLAKIKDPKVSIDVGLGSVDLPPWINDWNYRPEVTLPIPDPSPLDAQIQMHARGGVVLPFGPRVGRERLIGATPGEVILTAAQQANLAATLAGDGASGGQTVHIDARGAFIADGPSFDKWLSGKMQSVVFHDVSGMRRVLRKVATGKVA